VADRSLLPSKFYLQDTQSSLLILPPLDAFAPGSVDRKGVDQALAAAKKLKVKIATLTLDPKSGEPKLKVIFDSYNSSTQGQKLFPQSQSNGKTAEEQDVALVLHTSGTTGKPKGSSRSLIPSAAPPAEPGLIFSAP
jgi:long-subunit acyl-CoA synthetase (AMP-forming)